MSYYITAHRHGSKINVPVEEKHRYITDSAIPSFNGADITGLSQELNTSETYTSNNLGVFRNDYRGEIASTTSGTTKRGSSTSSDGIVQGLNLLDSTIRLFYRPEQLHIEQGTGPQQRIGDKVFLKSVNIMINLAATQSWMTAFSPNDKTQVNADLPTFRPTAFTTTNTGGVITGGAITTTETDTRFYNVIDWRKNIRQWAKFKIMIVRFNDLTDAQTTSESALKEYIQDWFNTIYVPSIIIPNTTTDSSGEPVYKDINVVSVQSTMKRESTKYNGKYQIMYDKIIELGQNDTNKFIQIDLEPKMNLTFEDDENGMSHPTSERYNNVYGFIIPPTYYRMDMDTCTYQALQTNIESSASFNLATFTTNIKFTYYDI